MRDFPYPPDALPANNSPLFGVLLTLTCASPLPPNPQPPVALGRCHSPQVPPKTVEITADDTMKFSISVIEVTPNQKITVTLKNTGTSPKASMGHDFLVLKKNTNMMVFLEAGAMDAAHEYVAPAMEKDVVARTKLLGPGESDTITFTAPYVPGDYDFICSFPGHATQGMKGIMTVK